jgi:endonuclease/exonuclease/phosphatase family metal-dependent hydrolase
MWNVCLALSLFGLVRMTGYLHEPLLPVATIHAVVGEPTRVAARGGLDIPSRVVTWNIERGARYESILRELRHLDADIVVLQEVDAYARRSGLRDVAADLARDLEMNWVRAAEFQEIGEGTSRRAALTGQAILSRFTIHNPAAIRFQNQARFRWTLNPSQPRRGGRIGLKATTGGLVVYNLHLESGSNEHLRTLQFEEILQNAAAHEIQPVMIAGDLNNRDGSRSHVFRALATAAVADLIPDADGRGPTSFGQPMAIDWILGRGFSAGTGRVVAVSAPASDHFPVFATITQATALSGATTNSRISVDSGR